MSDIYTLFDGLAYNTYGYFASCAVFFRAPKGQGKMRAMRFIIPLQKKKKLQLASILFRFSVIKLSMSSSLSCPISVCSVVSFCSGKSASVNKSSSSLKKSNLKDPNKSKLGHSPVRPLQP